MVTEHTKTKHNIDTVVTVVLYQHFKKKNHFLLSPSTYLSRPSLFLSLSSSLTLSTTHSIHAISYGHRWRPYLSRHFTGMKRRWREGSVVVFGAVFPRSGPHRHRDFQVCQEDDWKEVRRRSSSPVLQKIYLNWLMVVRTAT